MTLALATPFPSNVAVLPLLSTNRLSCCSIPSSSSPRGLSRLLPPHMPGVEVASDDNVGGSLKLNGLQEPFKHFSGLSGRGVAAQKKNDTLDLGGNQARDVTQPHPLDW